ncbi:MAG: ATP-binding protein [Candidatus Marinimicrobia bacterium]|nr:response regulator [bacterium]MCG2717132.1 ATP-binding protein [Candidatus Neomarinimicrobiota bacterium]
MNSDKNNKQLSRIMDNRDPMNDLKIDALKRRLDEQKSLWKATLNILDDANEARKALERSDRLKNVFLSMISHELRTPLNVVLGYIDILSKDLKSLLNEEKQEMFDSILQGGERLKKLVDDIMDITQIEADRIKLDMQPIDGDGLVKKCVNDIVIPARNKNIDIIEKYHGDKTRIKVDKLRFFHALGNILQNAIKFTHKGSVTIATEKKKGYYNITVKDTGIGIKNNFIPFMFALFRQEDEGYKRKYEGAGLGLHISQRLFTSMGGKINVESKEGQGTTFTISLPVSNKEIITEGKKISPPIIEKPLERKYERKKKSVLILEDNPPAVDYIQFLLRRIQVSYITANTGEKALELLEDNSPDGMLIDISLAVGMSGIEFMKKVKKQERFKNIPVVAVTAHAMKGQREQFIEAGFDDYLSKPFTLNDVRELFTRTLT